MIIMALWENPLRFSSIIGIVLNQLLVTYHYTYISMNLSSYLRRFYLKQMVIKTEHTNAQDSREKDQRMFSSKGNITSTQGSEIIAEKYKSQSWWAAAHRNSEQWGQCAQTHSNPDQTTSQHEERAGHRILPQPWSYWQLPAAERE